MAIARGFAAIAIFGSFAIGFAIPASAAAQLSGHYTETETFPDGRQATNDWYITPCGDGCASVNNWGQANLINGQWVMDSSGTVSCEEGGSVPNAIATHYVWDPNTLAGTVVITNNVPACGNPAGFQETNQLQLTQAP